MDLPEVAIPFLSSQPLALSQFRPVGCVMRRLNSRSQSRQEIGQKPMCQQIQTTISQGLGDLGDKKRQANGELCHTTLAPQLINRLRFASSRLGDLALKTSPSQHSHRHTPPLPVSPYSSRRRLCHTDTRSQANNIPTSSEQYVNDVKSHSPKGLANLTSRTFREREVVSCNIRKKSVASYWEGEAPAEPRSTCRAHPQLTAGRKPLTVPREFRRLCHAPSVVWPSALRRRPPGCVTQLRKVPLPSSNLKFAVCNSQFAMSHPVSRHPKPPRQFVKNFASALRFPLEKTSHRLDKMVHICEIAVEYPAGIRLPTLPNRKLP